MDGRIKTLELNVVHTYTMLCVIQSRRQQVCKTLDIEISKTSNADILQRLVRRYLFKLERLKEDGAYGSVSVRPA